MAKVYKVKSHIMTTAWSVAKAIRRVVAELRGIKGDAGIIYTIITMHLLPANRWFAQRYNVNNAWIFNGNNGNLNNNNVNNAITVSAVANLSGLSKM